MTTWTIQSKNTSTYSNQTKHSSTYTNSSKPVLNQFLLKEDGYYLLLENGGKIILEQNVPSYTPQYTLETKH